jgi:hypothetical protein
MIYKRLLLAALSLLSGVLHAEPVNAFNQASTSQHSKTTSQNDQPLSARQQKREQKQLKKQQKKLSRGARKKRGWGIAAGILGFFAVVAIPLFLLSACIGGGLAAVK